MLIASLLVIATNSFKVNAATGTQKYYWKKVVRALKTYGDKYKKYYVLQKGKAAFATKKSGSFIDFNYNDVGGNGISVYFTLKKSLKSFTMHCDSIGEEGFWELKKKFKVRKFNPRSHNYKYKVTDIAGASKWYANYESNYYVCKWVKKINSALKTRTGVSFKQLGFKKF